MIVNKNIWSNILTAFAALLCFSQCFGQREIAQYSYIELPIHISGHIDEDCGEKNTLYKQQTLTFEVGFNDSVLCIYNEKVIMDTLLKTNKALGVVLKELVVNITSQKEDTIELFFLISKRKATLKLNPNYRHIYISRYPEYLDIDYSNCDREYY